MSLDWQSNAKWPEGQYSSGNDITTDRHLTRDGAEGACDILQEEGWGGEGNVLPLSTWTTYFGHDQNIIDANPHIDRVQ